MILIDTGPLVALCHPRDRQHKRAATHLSELAGNQFGVCDAVLAEACFHLPHRAQRQRLGALLDALDVTSVPTMANAGYRREVFNWLIKYADHEPDWADACIVVLCGDDDTLGVWTYDREFRTTWRRPDGTRIPMAVA